MDSKKFLVISFFLFALSFGHAAVENVDCNQYYRFDGLKFNILDPEKSEYSQGETALFNYEIENLFGSPLAEGQIKVLMMYEGQEVVNRVEDADIVDDLYAATDVNLLAGDKYPGRFGWDIPKNAKPGVYVAKVYFPVKDKFNVAGISFMSSVPAKSATFVVLGNDSGVFMLDKNRTSFNGNPYGFRDHIPGISPGTPASIKTYLNDPKGESVNVSFELFDWDDAGDIFAQYSKGEMAGYSKDLSYELPALPVGVYVARITASTPDWKSILKVRFYVQGAKARFVWLGLDRFPLMKDDASTLAFCYSNSAVPPRDINTTLPANIKIKVSDESGNTVYEETYKASNITANIEGRKIAFSAPKQLTKLTLSASIYGINGELMDEVAIIYDYSRFKNIEKNFALKAPDTASDSIDYSVEYTDKYGDGVDGNVVVYLSSPDGSISSLSEANYSGKYSGKFSLAGLPGGAYTIKAVEKKETLSDKKIVTVGKQVSSTTVPETTPTTPEETQVPGKTGDSNLLIYAVLGIAIIAIAIFYLRFRPKKGEKMKNEKTEKSLFTLLALLFCITAYIGGAHALQVTAAYDPMDKSECTCSKYCDDSGDTKITRFTIHCWDYSAQITVPEDMKLVTSDKHVVGDQLCVGDKFTFQSAVSGGTYGGDGGEYWEDGGETDSPPVLWITDIEEAVKEVLGCSNKKGTDYVTKFKSALYPSSTSGGGSSGLCAGSSSVESDLESRIFMKCPGIDCFSGEYNDDMPINDVGLVGGGSKTYKSLKGNIACRVEQKNASSGAAILSGDYYEVTKKEDINFSSEIEVQCVYYFEKNPSFGGVPSKTGLGLGVPSAYVCPLTTGTDASVSAAQVFYSDSAGMQSVCNTVKAKGFKVGSLKFQKNIKVVSKGNVKAELSVIGADSIKFGEENFLKVLMKNTGEDEFTVKDISSQGTHRFISCDASPVKPGTEAECMFSVTPARGQGLTVSVEYEYMSCGRPIRPIISKVLFESKLVSPKDSIQVYGISVHGNCENSYFDCSSPDRNGKFYIGYECNNKDNSYFSPARARGVLRFELPDMSGKKVLGASLNLMVAKVNRAQEIAVYSADGNWTEASCSPGGDICTQPYCGECSMSYNAAGTKLAGKAVNAGGYLTLDVSDQVVKAYGSAEKTISLELQGEEDLWNSNGKDSCGAIGSWAKDTIELQGRVGTNLEIAYI